VSLTWDIITYLRQPSKSADALDPAALQNPSSGGMQQGVLVAATIKFLRFRADRRRAPSAADEAEADWARRLEDAVKRADGVLQDAAVPTGEKSSQARIKAVALYNFKDVKAAELDVLRAKAELRRAVRFHHPISHPAILLDFSFYPHGNSLHWCVCQFM
jgi:hypothetical protein